ncbi:MAG: CDP-glycerol glycerophosphotransferase family protein [Thalassovita sp.]
MIHFNKTNSKNYAQVQTQILGSISKHFPEGGWSESFEYEEGKLNFSLFINQKSDVLMSHGAADKNYHWRKDPDVEGGRLNHSLERKHLFVPGPWLKRRIVESAHLDFNEDQVHAIGWPRLDQLIEDQKALEADQVEGAQKKVLWAPTHDFARRGKKQVSLSSYPKFEKFIPKLEKHYSVSTSLHPRNRKEKNPTVHSLVESDVVITDFGTMVYEAVALGKQVIYPDWIVGEPITRHLKNSAENAIFKEQFGLHANSFKEMRAMIDSEQKIDERSQAFFDDFLPPETYGVSGKLIADTLMQIDSAG